MTRALAGKTVSVDVEFRFSDSGRSGWVSNTYSPHRNAQGEIVGVIGIVRDISERKRSEEAVRENERRFRAVFERAGDALLIFDDEARLVDVNAAACELYGRPREELLGQRMEDLRTSEYRFQDAWRELLREGHLRGEIRVPRPDGTIRDVEYEATARFLPGRHVTIQRDITDRRRAERRERVFSDLGLKLSSAQTASEAAGVIAGCADDLWHWDACTVDLYSEGTDRVDPLLTVDTIDGERRSVAPTRVNAPPSPRLRRVLREGARILLREASVTESDSIPFGDTARLSRSILAVPIRDAASVVGFLTVQSYSPKAYDGRDLESLQSLADLCGGAFVRVRIFEELRRGEQKLREAQAIGRIGIWERDLRDDSIIWSEEMFKFFDLDPRTFRPTLQGIVDRILPRDRLTARQERETAIRERRPSRQEFRILRADGSVAVIQSRGDVVLDQSGEPVRMVGVAQDITDQRNADERLRRSNRELRALWARLGAVREEESTRIARAVHDEVGQALTALKLDLSWVQKRLARRAVGEDPALVPKLETMVALMDTTLDAVHRIATELRPGVLQELGLEAAVDWYAQEFQKRTEIACRLRSALNGTEVDNQRSTAAFRIFQEILTNVARHAAATEVEVFLGTEKGDLVLETSDNGRGIPEERISDSRCLGLLGMRERARSFGGNVVIRAPAGGGTAVSVRIPL
jgi:PAS domain S-box-containing protein